MCVCLIGQFSYQGCVHQGAVVSPLLITIFYEALSRSFKICRSWELLYAGDLVLVAETLEDLLKKPAIWKDKFCGKGDSFQCL